MTVTCQRGGLQECEGNCGGALRHLRMLLPQLLLALWLALLLHLGWHCGL